MTQIVDLTVTISASTNGPAIDHLIRESRAKVVAQASDAYAGFESALAEVDAVMQLSDDDIAALAQQALTV